MVVGDGSDIGGGASIMGTLSGGGKDRISVGGAACSARTPASASRSATTASSRPAATSPPAPRSPCSAGRRAGGRKAAELSGASNVLFRRNSTTGAVEAVPLGGHGIELNADPACQLRPTGGGRGATSASSRARPAVALVVRSRFAAGPPRRGAAAGPGGLHGRGRRQSVVDLSTEQAENAATIVAVAVRRGLPARAASIALATAFQESKLQQPATTATATRSGCSSSGRRRAGAPRRRSGTRSTRPTRSTTRWQKINGYQHMRITEAAQEVQRSGFPEAYDDHEADARALASALTGYSPARFSCVVDPASDRPPSSRDPAA